MIALRKIWPRRLGYLKNISAPILINGIALTPSPAGWPDETLADRTQVAGGQPVGADLFPFSLSRFDNPGCFD
jgi:hypothetical protein